MIPFLRILSIELSEANRSRSSALGMISFNIRKHSCLLISRYLNTYQPNQDQMPFFATFKPARFGCLPKTGSNSLDMKA